jgi:hypothetical protein
MTRRVMLLVLACTVMWLLGCGGGGGGSSSDPDPVTFTADQMTLQGQASWPGATTVSVEIDGAPVTVTAGNWTHAISLAGVSEKTVRIIVIADGVAVAIRDVNVRR